MDNLSPAALDELPDGGLVVGYSGGLDSTVLLHALAALPAARKRGLRALHIDHGLHSDSGQWALQCERVCAALQVPFSALRVQVLADGSGPEAAARKARWRAYSTDVTVNEILTLAQHRDDQAETVLLRLLRGSGPAGLTAMQTWSQRRDGLRIWRPLLDVSRAHLHTQAQTWGLSWQDDPSNDDSRFDRNWLRHQALPLLRQRWPEIDASLARVAHRQGDAYALEQHCGRSLLALAATPDPRVLQIPPLLAASAPMCRAALRTWLHSLDLARAGTDLLERIDRELLRARPDADPRIEIPHRSSDADVDTGCVLRRHRDELHVLHAHGDQSLHYDLPWDGREPLQLPGVGQLSLSPPAQLPLAMRLRSRQGGERLRMRDQGRERPLKHLLQEAGVPTWLRQRWPVLWLEPDSDGEQVVGFADVLVSDRLQEVLSHQGCQLIFAAD